MGTVSPRNTYPRTFGDSAEGADLGKSELIELSYLYWWQLRAESEGAALRSVQTCGWPPPVQGSEALYPVPKGGTRPRVPFPKACFSHRPRPLRPLQGRSVLREETGGVGLRPQPPANFCDPSGVESHGHKKPVVSPRGRGSTTG